MFRFMTLLLIALTLYTCHSNEERHALPGQKQDRSFAPSHDSIVTPQQVRAWSRCNPRLDSLAYIYQDSFSTEDPNLLLKYRRSFLALQDSICIRNGLYGGYREYIRILNNAGRVKNKRLLDSLGFTSWQ